MNKQVFSYTFGFLLLFICNFSYGKETKIDWELTNPFKFIHDVSFYNEAKSIYDKLPNDNKLNTPALTLEKILHAKPKYKGNNNRENGWAAKIAGKEGDYFAATCWDANLLLYKKSGKCKNFIHPSEHEIKIWLNNQTFPLDTKCQWTYGTNHVTSLCSNPVILTIPYPTGLLVNVIPLINNEQLSFSKNIIVKDTLVVGLGDSYGSGEGNPDIPAKFTFTNKGRVNKDWIVTRNLYTPDKDKNGSAVWLDKRCHRSLYSYQFKTAFLMSLENRKRAVTFISYSCSGAIIPNIENKWKTAIEKTKITNKDYRDIKVEVLSTASTGSNNGRRPKQHTKTYNRNRKVMPQIDMLIKDITCPKNESSNCNKGMREIDYVLLSIGGNDIGFAEYGIRVAFKKKGYKRVLNKILGKKPGKKTQKAITKLTKSYEKLNKLLSTRVPIKNCGSMVCDNIILTGYPNILNDNKGNLCLSAGGAFDVPFGKDNGRGKRIKEIFDKVVKPLQDTQKKLPMWSKVFKHDASYAKHGLCAKDENNLSSANEQFIIPHKKKKSARTWLPEGFIPADYRTYTSRQRWVRIPIDSKLSMDMTKKMFYFIKDFAFSDESSGIIHPTSEGLSATADATIQMIRQLESNNVVVSQP